MSSHRQSQPATAMRRTVSLMLPLLLITAWLVPLPPTLAAPGAIPVTTTADEFGTGDDCSLREAISAAGTDAPFGGCPAGSGNDTISLPAGTYTLTKTGTYDDDNQTGDLDIDSNLVISGAGQASTTIDGNGLDRVIHVHTGSVRLYQLTVTGGQAPSGSPGYHGAAPGANGSSGGEGYDGGGIHNAGSLKLELVTIHGNKAGNGGKGGDGAPGAPGSGGPGGPALMVVMAAVGATVAASTTPRDPPSGLSRPPYTTPKQAMAAVAAMGVQAARATATMLAAAVEMEVMHSEAAAAVACAASVAAP